MADYCGNFRRAFTCSGYYFDPGISIPERKIIINTPYTENDKIKKCMRNIFARQLKWKSREKV